MDINVDDYVTTDSTSIDPKYHRVPMKVVEIDETREIVTVETADNNHSKQPFFFNEITSIKRAVAVDPVLEAEPDDKPSPKDPEDNSKRRRDDILRSVFGG